MTRLIDADSIPWLVEGVGEIPVITKDEIDQLPTVNIPTTVGESVGVMPIRHGKWIDEGYYADNTNIKAWHCSECNWHMLGYSDELFRYCPMCGARMDEE